MSIDTAFLRRCIRTLERALEEIGKHGSADDIFCDIHRAACVKEFELTLERSVKLLRKRLAPFFASNRGGSPYLQGAFPPCGEAWAYRRGRGRALASIPRQPERYSA